MRIGVNASTLKNTRFQLFLELASLHQQHTFLFFFDHENKAATFPENVIPIILNPAATNVLKRRIWYHLKLPASLKKNKADVFVSEKFLSLKTKVPQILMQPDLTYIYHPGFIDKKEISFHKKNTKKFIEKANAIVVNSFYLKNEIVLRFKTPDEKITVIYPSVKMDRKTATGDERELTKEKYAGGNEYFIYKGIISTERNLVNLLKAFSFFKKRQRSKMQLIITGERGEKYDEFLRSLESYRFKEDIKVLEELGETDTVQLLSSAYAMVFVPSYATAAIEVIEAMRCEVPLITSSPPLLKEYCGEAALYADSEKPNDIAEKMMLLFKDEQLRKALIAKGRLQHHVFKTSNEIETLFSIIKKAIV